MKMYKQGFLSILALIGISSGALAYMNTQEKAVNSTPQNSTEKKVEISTALVQNKILQGSDGKIGLALTLTGATLPKQSQLETPPLDLVVVLDQSGSMGGQKINDAKTAIIGLMNRLSPEDRLAILTYSNHVEMVSPLVRMNATNREDLSRRVSHIRSGGGTNLGGGLQQGLATLLTSDAERRQQKLILLSDGLANQGIIDPYQLGKMAADGAEHNLAVSTVGVGYDFNEVLMTTIADYGAGNYYFLEDPQHFARVFEKEFQTTRNVIANNLEIRIPLLNGIQLIDAGGFPITQDKNFAVIKPGDLLSGQQRKLFLTLQFPTKDKGSFNVSNIEASYHQNGTEEKVTNNRILTIKCIEDKKAVLASIDGESWSEQVVKEEYNRLKNDVATSIRKGQKSEALQSIHEYKVKNSTLNQSVGSSRVAQNLEEDVDILKQNVEKTFSGAPAAVAQKKKQQAKTLQYESYKIRRDKQ